MCLIPAVRRSSHRLVDTSYYTLQKVLLADPSSWWYGWMQSVHWRDMSLSKARDCKHNSDQLRFTTPSGVEYDPFQRSNFQRRAVRELSEWASRRKLSRRWLQEETNRQKRHPELKFLTVKLSWHIYVYTYFKLCILQIYCNPHYRELLSSVFLANSNDHGPESHLEKHHLRS